MEVGLQQLAQAPARAWPFVTPPNCDCRRPKQGNTAQALHALKRMAAATALAMGSMGGVHLLRQLPCAHQALTQGQPAYGFLACRQFEIPIVGTFQLDVNNIQVMSFSVSR